MAQHRTHDFRIVTAGDSAVVVEFEERIDADVNAKVVAVAEAIEAERIGGIRDVVPTFRSVAIYFDPLRTDFDRLNARLEVAAANARPEATIAREPIPVPVSYGGEFGPDLEEVARSTGMTEGEVIARHAAPVYRVFMLGFVPGFPYMGTVDPKISVPRRSTPRPRVPAGSVGIAGAQTGIYPFETPGGWQIIGRTLMKPFDPARAEPFLLQAGDSVRFHPDASPGERRAATV
jgi:inhibitor of KinA